MSNKRKVQLKFYVDPEISVQMHNLAFSKYGNFHGALSMEGEEACKNWIMAHTTAHTMPLLMGKINPSPRAYTLWQECKKWLQDNKGLFLISQHQIVESSMVEAISALRGSDRRTVMKWMKEFKYYKLIKHVAGAVWEIV